MAAHPDWLAVRTVSVSLDTTLAFPDVGQREAIGMAKELVADTFSIDAPEGCEAVP